MGCGPFGADDVPYKDAETRKQWAREYRRRTRALGNGEPEKLVIPALEKPGDVVTLLCEEIARLRAARKLDVAVRARVIASLSRVVLDGLTAGDLETRIAALEKGLHNDVN
jgi:hypothetical protein